MTANSTPTESTILTSEEVSPAVVGELPEVEYVKQPPAPYVPTYLVFKLITGETIIGELMMMNPGIGVSIIKFPYSITPVMTERRNTLWLQDWAPYSADDSVPVSLGCIVSTINPTQSIVHTYLELVQEKLINRMPDDHKKALLSLPTDNPN